MEPESITVSAEVFFGAVGEIESLWIDFSEK